MVGSGAGGGEGDCDQPHSVGGGPADSFGPIGGGGDWSADSSGIATSFGVGGDRQARRPEVFGEGVPGDSVGGGSGVGAGRAGVTHGNGAGGFTGSYGGVDAVLCGSGGGSPVAVSNGAAVAVGVCSVSGGGDRFGGLPGVGIGRSGSGSGIWGVDAP